MTMMAMMMTPTTTYTPPPIKATTFGDEKGNTNDNSNGPGSSSQQPSSSSSLVVGGTSHRDHGVDEPEDPTMMAVEEPTTTQNSDGDDNTRITTTTNTHLLSTATATASSDGHVSCSGSTDTEAVAPKSILREDGSSSMMQLVASLRTRSSLLLVLVVVFFFLSVVIISTEDQNGSFVQLIFRTLVLCGMIMLGLASVRFNQQSNRKEKITKSGSQSETNCGGQGNILDGSSNTDGHIWNRIGVLASPEPKQRQQKVRFASSTSFVNRKQHNKRPFVRRTGTTAGTGTTTKEFQSPGLAQKTSESSIKENSNCQHPKLKQLKYQNPVSLSSSSSSSSFSSEVFGTKTWNTTTAMMRLNNGLSKPNKEECDESYLHTPMVKREGIVNATTAQEQHHPQQPTQTPIQTPSLSTTRPPVKADGNEQLHGAFGTAGSLETSPPPAPFKLPPIKKHSNHSAIHPGQVVEGGGGDDEEEDDDDLSLNFLHPSNVFGAHGGSRRGRGGRSKKLRDSITGQPVETLADRIATQRQQTLYSIPSIDECPTDEQSFDLSPIMPLRATTTTQISLLNTMHDGGPNNVPSYSSSNKRHLMNSSNSRKDNLLSSRRNFSSSTENRYLK